MTALPVRSCNASSGARHRHTPGGCSTGVARQERQHFRGPAWRTARHVRTRSPIEDEKVEFLEQPTFTAREQKLVTFAGPRTQLQGRRIGPVFGFERTATYHVCQHSAAFVAACLLGSLRCTRAITDESRHTRTFQRPCEDDKDSQLRRAGGGEAENNAAAGRRGRPTTAKDAA